MHPSREVEREYAVRVLVKLMMQNSSIDSWVQLEDGPASFRSVFLSRR